MNQIIGQSPRENIEPSRPLGTDTGGASADTAHSNPVRPLAIVILLVDLRDFVRASEENIYSRSRSLRRGRCFNIGGSVWNFVAVSPGFNGRIGSLHFRIHWHRQSND